MTTETAWFIADVVAYCMAGAWTGQKIGEWLYND